MRVGVGVAVHVEVRVKVRVNCAAAVNCEAWVVGVRVGVSVFVGT